MGPPLSGKTKLAELLSEFYSLPHITVKEVVDAKIAELVCSYLKHYQMDNIIDFD